MTKKCQALFLVVVEGGSTHYCNYHLSPGAGPGKSDPEWDCVAHLGELSFHLWPAARATSLAPPGRAQHLTGQAWVALSPASTRLLSLCALWDFACGFNESLHVTLKSCQLLLLGIKFSLCWGWTPRHFSQGSCGLSKPSCEHLSSVIRCTSWGSSQTASKQTVRPARLWCVCERERHISPTSF